MTLPRIEPEIQLAAPEYCGCMIGCTVENSLSQPDLWQEIDAETVRIRRLYALETLNKRPAVAAMRRLYKALGKDPNRYRPSAEALCRRLLQGKELYRIHTLVDLINLLSIRYGFSIGGFDSDKVNGQLSIGAGRAGELFEGIGRGLLNIEGLPVYRDETGPIGTPTSDEERTSLSPETTHLLMIIHSADGRDQLAEATADAVLLLKKYAAATDIGQLEF